MNGWKRILVALDVSSSADAVSLVRATKDYVGGYKVGKEVIAAVGPGIIKDIKDAGAEMIFDDEKPHDIPNTVAKTVAAIAKRGIWAYNLHTSGGLAMMIAAKEASDKAASELGIEAPKVIGVTVLTSISEQIMNEELRVPGLVRDQVVHLAELAQKAGLDGVVASGMEAAAIRKACGEDFIIITPGVRLPESDKADQKRIVTPWEAVKLGATYIVVGRDITQSKDPALTAAYIASKLPA